MIIQQQADMNILTKRYSYRCYNIEKLYNGITKVPSYEFWWYDEQVLAFKTLGEIKKHIDIHDPLSTYLTCLMLAHGNQQPNRKKEMIARIKGEYKS